MNTKIVNFKEASTQIAEREMLYCQIKEEIQNISKRYTKLLNEEGRNFFYNGGNFQVFKKKIENLERQMIEKKKYLQENFQNEMRIERENLRLLKLM